MKSSYLFVLLVGLFSCFEGHDSLQDPPVGLGSQEPSLVATDYGLILSWLEPIDGDIHLRYSVYQAPVWSAPKTVAKGGNWFVNWADFPALISNGDGLFAHFLERSGVETYDYDIMYTMSNDRGQNWSKPTKLHSDTVKGEHGFVSGIPYEEGFAVTWLDGRYTAAETPRMSLRGAIIDGSGLVTKDYELDSMVCDCCQTTMAKGNNPLVFYRDRTIDEIRDIKIVSFSPQGTTVPTSLHDDLWQINACPVNGPAASRDAEFLAVAWFSGKDGQSEVKLKISEDAGINFGKAILVDGPDSFGRVDIQLHNNKILVTYLTRNNNGTSIVLATYDYSGVLISKLPLASVSADRGTGFPRTAVWNNNLVVSWTDIEESRVKVLSVPLDDKQLGTSPM